MLLPYRIKLLFFAYFCYFIQLYWVLRDLIRQSLFYTNCRGAFSTFLGDGGVCSLWWSNSISLHRRHLRASALMTKGLMNPTPKTNFVWWWWTSAQENEGSWRVACYLARLISKQLCLPVLGPGEEDRVVKHLDLQERSQEMSLSSTWGQVFIKILWGLIRWETILIASRKRSSQLRTNILKL